jgi:hypothetical protein
MDSFKGWVGNQRPEKTASAAEALKLVDDIETDDTVGLMALSDMLEELDYPEVKEFRKAITTLQQVPHLPNAMSHRFSRQGFNFWHAWEEVIRWQDKIRGWLARRRVA